MSELLLPDDTRQALERFLAKPAHSLLLSGPAGSGKAMVARWLAAELLEIEPEAVATYGYYLEIQPAGESISINAIREVQRFTHLRTIGQRPIRRVLFIDEADKLTTEAQNAFLKLLEEPPGDTVILLTTTAPHQLLPTILSRLQRIGVKSPAQSAIRHHFQQAGYKPTDIERAYRISDGQIGLMQALLQDETEQGLPAAIDQAKNLLVASRYERLCQVDSLAKDKAAIPPLLEAIQKICRAGLMSAIQADKPVDAAVWLTHFKQILRAQEQWQIHPQAKLFLTNLLLNI